MKNNQTILIVDDIKENIDLVIVNSGVKIGSMEAA